jgi:hypothetical protein
MKDKIRVTIPTDSVLHKTVTPGREAALTVDANALKGVEPTGRFGGKETVSVRTMGGQELVVASDWKISVEIES